MMSADEKAIGGGHVQYSLAAYDCHFFVVVKADGALRIL